MVNSRPLALAFLLFQMWLCPAAPGQPLLPRLSAMILPEGASPQSPPVLEPVRPGETDLRLARRLAVQTLIRAHPEVIDRDARGEAIVRGEVLATSPSARSLERIRPAGFTVLRESVLAGLDIRIVTVAIPAGMSPRRTLRTLRRLDPEGSYDFNHIYTPAGDLPVEPSGAGPGGPSAAPAAPAAVPGSVLVGLVDGGVSPSHPAFDQGAIRRFGCDGKTVASPHGTAVASLLVGSSATFRGVVPGATLYAADVYCGLPTGGSVLALAAAFSWLAEARVPVINVGLVGPPNAALRRVVRRLIDTGRIIVAPVGNDGPGAAPLFPAAYIGVTGVTGVDARNGVLPEAGRGTQVAFAAPGADMAAAAGSESFAVVRGTSFAASIVAGLLAREFPAPGAGRPAALSRLAQTAIDLGSEGPDETFGAGVVGSQFRVEAEALSAPGPGVL